MCLNTDECVCIRCRLQHIFQAMMNINSLLAVASFDWGDIVRREPSSTSLSIDLQTINELNFIWRFVSKRLGRRRMLLKPLQRYECILLVTLSLFNVCVLIGCL
jgi:hypothetical protein